MKNMHNSLARKYVCVNIDISQQSDTQHNKTKEVIIMTKTNKLVSPDQIAAELNIDAKTVRRHLRAIIDQHNAKHEGDTDKQIAKPGRGGSWSVSVDVIDQIKTRLESRQAGRAVTVTADMLN